MFDWKAFQRQRRDAQIGFMLLCGVCSVLAACTGNEKVGPETASPVVPSPPAVGETSQASTDSSQQHDSKSPSNSPSDPKPFVIGQSEPVQRDQSVASVLSLGRTSVEQVAADFPDQADALEMLARYESAFGEPENSVVVWRRILDLNPRYVYALAGLGDYAVNAGDVATAVGYFRRAVNTDPSPLYRTKLAKALAENGELVEAREQLGQVLESTPDFVAARNELGAVLLQMQDYQAALSQYSNAIEIAPSDAAAHFGMMTTAMRMGERELAGKHKEIHRGLELQARENSGAAKKDYDDLQAVSADVAELLANTAKIYLGNDRREEARGLLEKAAEMAASHVESRYLMSQLAEQARDLKQAAKWQAEVQALQPESREHMVRSVLLLGASGDLNAAERCVQEFVERNPRDGQSVMMLAQFYVDAKPDLPMAIGLAERAVKLTRSADDYLFLASLLEVKGETGAAQEAIREAAALAPQSKEHQQALLATLRERFKSRWGK